MASSDKEFVKLRCEAHAKAQKAGGHPMIRLKPSELRAAMKYRRYDAKRDKAEPKIVEALENAGWAVYRELPVDLLALKRVDADHVLVRLLEAKTPQGKRNPKARVRKEQVAQNEFCERWSIPKPTTPIEALLAVGERVEIL